MRLLYFFQYPPSERHAERFGFGALRARGLEVAAWDLSPLYGFSEVGPWKRMESYRRFDSLAELRAAVEEQPRETFVICLLGYDMRAWPVLRALHRRGLAYGVVASAAHPAGSPPLRRLLGRLDFFRPRALVNLVLRRVPARWVGLSPAAMAIVGGRLGLATCQANYRALLARSTRLVWTHSFDYDRFLLEPPPPEGEPIGVFLDEYLPFHWEYAVRGQRAPLSAEEYYPRLRQLFARLEAELGIRMVVAAHPSSRYEDHPDYFGGREVRMGQTLALVRRARVVLAHASTSINFAVLLRRPLVLLTNQEVQAHMLGLGVDAMARRLHRTPVDFDRPETLDVARQMEVDEAAYANFAEDYIKTSESPAIPSWDSVGDFVEQWFERSLG